VSSPPGLDTSLESRVKNMESSLSFIPLPSGLLPSLRRRGLLLRRLRLRRFLLSPQKFLLASLAYLEGNVGGEKVSFLSPRAPFLGSRRHLKGSSSGLVPPCNTVTRGEHGQTNVYRAEWFSGGG